MGRLIKLVSESLNKVIRTSPSVAVVYEYQVEPFDKNKNIRVKIYAFLELHGKRPFDEKDYKAIHIGVFGEGINKRDYMGVDEFVETDKPVEDARAWAKKQLKNYKNL